MFSKKTLLFVFISIITQCQTYKNANDLSWPEVKSESKPGIYWWWMGSAVDSENLTYNLESLAEVGFGNVHVIPIYGVKGEEEKYIDFLSPKWIKMLAHTVNESKRLNMNVDMSTTTGWPFGGSHVTPENAAKKIEYKKISLSKGERINENFEYKNVKAIIAYSNYQEAFNLIDLLDSTGNINWIAPADKYEVYIISQEGTGQMVKRAAPGNVGLVLDPFSPLAMKKYLSRYDAAFANYSGPNLRAQYHDSYEYYNATWTNNFFKIFKERNSYDLQNYLPSILDTNKINPYIHADYRRTLAELHLNYIEDWSNWSHEKGWITRNEAHGAPANLLDLYAASDIPETETFGSRQFNIPGIRYLEENNSTSTPPNPLILKFASSAAHITGKQLVSSETGTWLRDHYKVALSQVKPEIDELFISGINHIFYHGNAYSPKDAQWPGWIFYASTHFEKENSLWRDFSELNLYVTRCQSFLQSGKPSNDILLYWPIEDVYHSYPKNLLKTMTVHNIDWFKDSEFGKLASDLDNRGYSFDYISDNQVLNVEFEKNKLKTAGNYYKTIIIPKTKHLPLRTLKKLKSLAADGAVIVMHKTLPEDVPGFSELENRRRYLQKSLSELKFKEINGNKLQRANVGNGYFLLSRNIDSGLKYVDVKREKIAEKGINYIRRKYDDGYCYFLTNLSGIKLNSWIPLSVEFQSAAIFDPRNENKNGFAAIRKNKNNSEIYIQMNPGESIIVKTYDNNIIKGKNWEYYATENKPIKIEGTWKIEFVEGGPIIPNSYSTKELNSWTNQKDINAESFAGTGRYSITFNLHNIKADNWRLDLGKVCESARVKMNGEEVGTLWSFPFNLLIGKYLKQGENRLEIEVTNLSANRIRDLDIRGVNWKKFFFVNIFYKKFDASKWPIMDSGLFGPVTLTPLKLFTPGDE